MRPRSEGDGATLVHTRTQALPLLSLARLLSRSFSSRTVCQGRTDAHTDGRLGLHTAGQMLYLEGIYQPHGACKCCPSKGAPAANPTTLR